MTKKDFKLIADIIKEMYLGHSNWQRSQAQVIYKFCTVLKEKYPNFDQSKFIEACTK